MTITVVGLVSINDDQPYALAKYLEITEPLLECFGAKIVKRYALAADVVGESPVQTVIVVEYPDMETVEKVFSSTEYARAIPYRDLAFSRYSVHIPA